MKTITTPQFANSPRADARYVIRYGHPVAYASDKLVTAVCEGVACEPTRMTDDGKAELARAMCEWAEEAGLRMGPHAWTDAAGHRFDSITITSRGYFVAAECDPGGLGNEVIRLEDPDRVASLLWAAATNGAI